MSEYMETLKDEEFLPEGWTEDTDIFSSEGWAEPTGEQAEPEEAPTTEQEPETQGEPESVPTTEQEEEKPEKLKFTARVDHQDLDVELDRSELPTMYQKARNTERVQARMNEQSAQREKDEARAKALGFDSLNSMLESAEKTHRDHEVERLVRDGVHEEVAKAMVERKAPEQQRTAPRTERDFMQESLDLLSARPELRGKSIPDEVIRVSATEKKPLVVAYAEYEARQQKAEVEKLRRENEILKQNAASAAKAPVSATTGGGATDTKPKDDFLSGFDDE